MDEKSEVKNLKTWQVGFFEKDKIVFFGAFDHILESDNNLGSDVHWDMLDKEEDDQVMMQTIREFVDGESYIYAYLVAEGDWRWVGDRPKNISWLKWKLTPRKEKYRAVLKGHLKKDGYDILSLLDDGWYSTLDAGKDKSFVDKYYRRLGQDPDCEPDILYLSKERVQDPIDKMKTNKMESLISQRFKDINEEDWKIWNDLLDTFDTILYAIDGHIFIATKKLNKEQIETKIKKVADKNNLEITKDHILY